MAYDQDLAERLEALVRRRRGFSHKKMFGGVAFLHYGNMCFGVHKDYLILRLGQDHAEKALKRKHTKPFDITGKPMKGWVMVHRDGTGAEATLKKWIEGAIRHAKQLPPKA
jgi:TfoX/Sxy family transcriptional regulator of competence genes